jgi:glutamate synthase (NADPH/NADH) small chain
MDCGTPFCHWGCPVGNYIPQWNEAVFCGQWQKAVDLLEATNSFPEITGRLCPAICEYACVLGINDDAVTIQENELAIIERAFKKGLIRPRPPKNRSGKKVAIVGSGPAGLACADQLNRAGHKVTIFEKDPKIGGIMRYGIPDFKLEKWVLDRRLSILKKEGIVFRTNTKIDVVPKRDFDAVCLAGGCQTPRDLDIEGRDLGGIYFAMDFLVQANKIAQGEKIPEGKLIDAKGKRVVIIGGGDTGADCVGVAHRQGARGVTQVEILPKPPECRPADMPWPEYPLILKTSTSHQEGGERFWSVLTKKFIGENGRVKGLSCVKLDCKKEVVGSEFEIAADLVILALGFLSSGVKTGLDFMTSQKGVFAAGDIRRGQSLIVWAIFDARCAAGCIDKYLKT